MIVLCDLEGTLANSAWREPLIELSGWHTYHGQHMEDAPIQRIVDFINVLAFKWDVVCITERPVTYYQSTLRWLHQSKVTISGLLMRPEDNWMPVPELKLLLAAPILAKLAFVVDDQDHVLERFRAHNITTLHVGQPQ